MGRLWTPETERGLGGRERGTALCSRGDQTKCGARAKRGRADAGELARRAGVGLPGDLEGLWKGRLRAGAMFRRVALRPRVPRAGARRRAGSIRGQAAEPVGLLCEGAHELVTGALDALGGLEARGCEDELVEGLEGGAGPEEAFGVGQAAEPVVGGGDFGLGIALFDAAGGACDVDGEQAGPVEVEVGGEGVAEEGVDEVCEGSREEDVAEPLSHDAPVPGFDEGGTW